MEKLSITTQAFSKFVDFSKLLKIENPWEVSSVSFDGSRVDIEIAFNSNKGECPDCGIVCKLHDRRKSREWRHLNTMQYPTYLHCQIPRVKCDKCQVKSLDIPWSESHNGFTLLFEDWAIDVLQLSRSVEEARKFLDLNWHQVQKIRERAVERGLKRRDIEQIDYIGIDEKSFRKGHRYITTLNDLDNSRVLEVVEGRKEKDAIELIKQGLDESQREGVKAVAVDMWKAFSNAAIKALPEADIVHDKFHIFSHLNEAVDKTRRKENKELLQNGDSSLVGQKYTFTRNAETIGKALVQSFNKLKESGYKTAKAWAIKEMFRHFWHYISKTWARKFFMTWYAWAVRCRIEPIKKVAKMLKKHLENILNYFTHRITNAVSEGINSKIQTVKSNSRGFRSFESFRYAILFYAGKLDLKYFPH